MRNIKLLFFSVLIVFSGWASADVRLPSIISDHMVLQKIDEVPIWGWADSGEEVSVTLDGQTVKTKAGADGKWRVSLNLENSAQGPFEMVVQGNNTIKIGDVVVGEVWLASGQSNMAFALGAMNEASVDTNVTLRQYFVHRKASLEPEEDCSGVWMTTIPSSAEYFSAIGYYFGKNIQASVGGAVGIINAAWGGKLVEPFISSVAISDSPTLKKQTDDKVKMIQAKKAAYSNWLKESGREDRSADNIAQFAVGPASADNGWVQVKDRGVVADPALPQYGAIWFRKDFRLPPERCGSPQIITFGPWVQFYRLYFNGVLIGESDMESYLGDRNMAQFLIPERLIRPDDVNHLAVRVFAPKIESGFGWPPFIAGTTLSGGWYAKAEFELPAPANGTPDLRLMPHFAAPGSIYNAMIHPLLPYAFRGVIWYQGEANTNNMAMAHEYRELFPLMIKSWRQEWGMEEMPFYFCQLANYLDKQNTPAESKWATLRESQLKTLALPNTGMAVLIDAGESKDIHPQRKDIAGDRLAKIALAKTYGKDIPFSGPIYESMTVEGEKARLKFRHIEGGLIAKDLPSTYDVVGKSKTTAPLVRNSPESELEGFAICGADKQWVWADARIDGDSVLVWSDKVPQPVAVRYAWADNPTCNLYNHAGLPASPFSTEAPLPSLP